MISISNSISITIISLISMSILIVILVDLCNCNVGDELKAVRAPHLKLLLLTNNIGSFVF